MPPYYADAINGSNSITVLSDNLYPLPSRHWPHPYQAPS